MLAYLRTCSSSSPTLLYSLPSTGSLPPAYMHVVVSPILKLSLDLASLFQQSSHLSPTFYTKTSHKNNLFCLLHFSPLIPELLLPSHFSRVWLCVTPSTAAHQAPPSLGFSRQDYWSGLPFASPRHACLLSRFSCFRLCGTLWTAAHWAPLGKNTGVGCHSFCRAHSNRLLIPLFHGVALIKVTSDLHTLESDSQLSAVILLDLRATAGPVDHSLLEILSSPDF